jgi:hypothetical protein
VDKNRPVTDGFGRGRQDATACSQRRVLDSPDGARWWSLISIGSRPGYGSRCAAFVRFKGARFALEDHLKNKSVLLDDCDICWCCAQLADDCRAPEDTGDRRAAITVVRSVSPRLLPDQAPASRDLLYPMP